MKTLLSIGHAGAGFLALLLAPAAGLGLLVGRHAGPALGLLALALATCLLTLGQAWEGLAAETQQVMALGVAILGFQFVGGVLARQALAAWSPRGALGQGALAGAALALGLSWLPASRAAIAEHAPPPPTQISALLLGLDHVLAHRPETALAEAHRTVLAALRLADRHL